jgi:tripeptidyl-peptidase-1
MRLTFPSHTAPTLHTVRPEMIQTSIRSTPIPKLVDTKVSTSSPPIPIMLNHKGQLQCGVYKPTNVISASYGQAESDLPIGYTKRQCNEFMKLGLQGHSILAASGDYGVASFAGDPEADGCLGPEGTIFNPQYPGNCPYITSVGGTQLYPDQTVFDRESVMHVNLSGTAQNFSSSGGFSNYFPQPSYQQAAIKEYFEIADLKYPYYSEFSPDFNTTTGLYNRIGRGYPDISANGANFRAFTDGFDYHWYGTSLASPLVASVLTLVCSAPFITLPLSTSPFFPFL